MSESSCGILQIGQIYNDMQTYDESMLENMTHASYLLASKSEEASAMMDSLS